MSARAVLLPVLTHIFVISNHFAMAHAADSLAEKVKALSESDNLRNAQWAASVKDASTGETILAFNDEKNMVPGSTLKLFVTAAALEILGPEHRFKTGLYAEGNIADGTLDGNLHIKGGGDPSFGSDIIKGAPTADDNFARWLEALQKVGIKKINGSVIADDSLFEGQPLPGNWGWEDIGNYYAAQPTALVINDNTFKLYFKPGEKVGDPAEVLRSEPAIDGLSFNNLMRTGPAGSGDNGYIYNFPGQYSAVLRGTVPQGPSEFAIKGSIPDPPLHLAMRFSAYLKEHGIGGPLQSRKAGPSKDYSKLKLLGEIESVALKDIVHMTNKRSFNLYAEILLRHLAVAAGKPGTTADGIAALKDFVAAKGLDASKLRLVDACGLSRLNLVQAGVFTDFLEKISTAKYFPLFLDSLPSPDDPEVTSHIKNMGVHTRLANNLKIKSGSLNGVRGYAGYLTTRSGKRLTFAFFVNNYSASPTELESIQEKLLLDIRERH